MDLIEFTGINANGNKEERKRTYSQSTTTAPQNWLWTLENSLNEENALLVVEMSIGRFEFQSIEVRTAVYAETALSVLEC